MEERNKKHRAVRKSVWPSADKTKPCIFTPKPTLSKQADTAERLDMSRKGYSTGFRNRVLMSTVSELHIFARRS
jgi:hypothetical protein